MHYGQRTQNKTDPTGLWHCGNIIKNTILRSQYQAVRFINREMPGEKGFSETNIRYMYRFYNLYSQLFINLPHPAEDLERKNFPQGVEGLTVSIIHTLWTI